MSVNTAHASNGVLIHAGEYILLHSDGVTMDFSGQDNPVFKGSKQGRIYLTSHRLIFNNKKPADDLQSFSAPFIALSDVELEQPVFGANYIKGKVRAQPNGNFIGEVKFKLHFKSGGAIEYGQALLRAASTAQSNYHRGGAYNDDPPPYTPSGAWHEAPPPAYQPPPGYYGWLPTHEAFSGPAPNTVFVSDNPPPYPGIGGPPAYIPQQYPQPGYNPQAGYTQPQAGYNPQHPQSGYNPQHPQAGYNPQQPQAGYNPQQPQAGYIPQQAQTGYNPQPPQGGGDPQPQYGNNDATSWMGFSAPPTDQSQQQPQPGNQPPPYGGTGYGQQGGYQPAAPGGYNPAYNPAYNPGYQHGGYPPPGGAPGGAAAGAMGFGMPPANSKEAEAMASSQNTTYNQYSNNAAPSDLPPAYDVSVAMLVFSY
ncbi:PREDICTED: WW domain-binding protein 2 isoform X2 [Rhagoletis zephyria]|uniref:WW domain-binding protein 2 isoform X2 n=1 Tax=Rhagoletis zephyria TaxID=28612 RepID=UPI0008119F0A|nr:PREDICTED: WW domain-binding protein 2 isoform X2 [Rhagoletis zephyria]